MVQGCAGAVRTRQGGHERECAALLKVEGVSYLRMPQSCEKNPRHIMYCVQGRMESLLLYFTCIGIGLFYGNIGSFI